MGKIFIEANDAPYKYGSATPYYHLYLVYEDDSGNEFVIRGGPSEGVSGLIFVEIGLPMTSNGLRGDGEKESEDSRLKSQRSERLSTEITFDDRDASIVWNQMLQQAENIHNSRIPYDTETVELGESDNSNSVIGSVLNSVGIDLQKILPIMGLSNFRVPGSQDIFSEYADSLNTILDGSNKSDIILGGYGDDNIFGYGGDDTLSGFTPFYTSKKLNDNYKEVDTLTGGAGSDLFVLGSSKERFYQNLTTPAGKSPVEIENEINPRTDGVYTYFLPSDITPQDFVVITDYNSQEGDKLQLKGPSSFGNEKINTYRTVAIQNSSYMELIDSQLSSNLSPELYSTAIIYSSGYNSTPDDFREDDLIAILPNNSNDYFTGGFDIDLSSNSNNVIFA